MSAARGELSAERRLNLVGGEWQGAGGSIEIRDPADERVVVASVPSMSAADVGKVYAAAAHGAETWRRTSAIERGQILSRAALLLRERSEQLAELLTREMGKLLAEARVEVAKSADFFEYYGGLGRAPRGELLAHERSDVHAYTVHEPLGVVLAITPWNDPLLTPARKLAPALLAGNSVVLKPASNTPVVALELARCLDDAGLPAGVLNTVTGSGAEIGAALTAHPALRAVSFTGSNEVGATLERDLAFADADVRLLAELGGKNASVVLADADPDKAAATIAAAAFAQAGQRCTATSRLIASRAVAAPLLDRLRQLATAHVLGSGLAGETTMGPLVSRSQRDDVLGFVERALADGADLLSGGSPPDREELRHGCFVEPTIFAGVSPASEIWTEEVFGPVLAVVVVDDDSEALDLLNGSRYGLAASVYSNDAAAIQRFVDAAEVGQIAVNLPTSGWDVHMPFGGFKESGSGHKEQGLSGLDFYRQTKVVAIAP